MSLVIPTAPKGVELRAHFSHMTAADDVMPGIEAALLETDLLLLEALGWSTALEVALRDAVHRKVKPQKTGTNFLFGQAGPFMLALAEKLYESPATPPVRFNDLPAGAGSVQKFAQVHRELSKLEEAVVLGWREQSFESVVRYCQALCVELNAAKMQRANHMLKRLHVVVNHARRQHGLQAHSPLRVLMLTGIDLVDIGKQLRLAAEHQPTFSLTVTRQENIETCMMTQFREFVRSGTVSELSAAALLARTLLLNARLPADGKLTEQLRATVDLEVAAMDINDIRRLYEA